jgi:hypothetical protein
MLHVLFAAVGTQTRMKTCFTAPSVALGMEAFVALDPTEESFASIGPLHEQSIFLRLLKEWVPLFF